ncbi:MAG: hypothetical protein ACJ72E_05805 [Marmoricola sp.]
MEILLWLLPAAVTTGVAMLWVSWVGRERPVRGRTDAEQERFAAAIMRPLPPTAAQRRTREPSTGVAVRPSQRPSQRPTQNPPQRPGETRRSA